VKPEDKLLLAAGTLIIPRVDLPKSVRDQLGDNEQDQFALTKAHSRSSSTMIDTALANLLGEFRSPSTVVEAIIRYSHRLGLDPDSALTTSYPALRQCLAKGYLVTADSDSAKPIEPIFEIGQRVAAGTVVRCLRLLEDSELHQVALDGGGMAAMKVLRAVRSSFGEGVLRREAAVLRHLDGRIAPRLLGLGETYGCQWLAMEWCDGVSATRAATAMRRTAGRDGELVHLCRRVVEAYAELHELGVIHGDVHPGNVIVASDGAVRLVDYGLARVVDGGNGDSPPRGGVSTYYDPEYAAASRARRLPGQSTFASEQFSLGALLYELITGSTYVDFSLDRGEMLRQIVEDRPLPFIRRGRRPWPEVEDLLGRTLAKHPGDRLPSTRELARRLAAATEPPTASGVTPATGMEEWLNSTLAKARPGGVWFEHGLPAGVPACSVAYGAAGVAAAIYHVAVLRADPELLALADEWAVRAGREAGNRTAFSSDELGLSEDVTGRVSPFHSLSGVHTVQGLVSHAVGDIRTRQEAVDAFVMESHQPCVGLDLTLGRAGTLLAAALLLEAIGTARYVNLEDLTELGNDTLAGIWAELDAMPPVAEATGVSYLGVAHGWAGLLLASLRWSQAASVPMPMNLVDRLNQLALLAQPDGRGARWPMRSNGGRKASTMAGWCHGSAGYLHLWTTAHEVLGDDRWSMLAEQAAWSTRTTANGIAQLCCGQAGQVYGLLAFYRHTGERRWLTAAGEVAMLMATDSVSRLADTTVAASLHKGITGITVLAADLADPEAAAMPFFGKET
jgi:serine/threonine-protein kinase